MREKVDFSASYYRTPARFAGRADGFSLEPSPETVKGKNVGVVTGSTHEAYLRLFFADAAIKTYPDLISAVDALKGGGVDLVFADGLTLSIWLTGEDSAQCCLFRGGSYTETKFFGEGVGVAVRKEDVNLRIAFDWALARIAQKGLYAELLRKYFPLGFQ